MDNQPNRGKGYNRAQRHRIAEQLRKAGLSKPVKVLPPMLGRYEATASLGVNGLRVQFEIDPNNRERFWYKSRTSDEWYPVNQKGGNKVVCGCPAFAANKLYGCEHLAHYCDLHGIDHPSVQRYKMRRIGEMFTIYPDGYAETTRRDKATAEEPEFIREFAYELCRDMKDSRPAKDEGRPREYDLCIVAYALIIKTHYAFSYDALRYDLKRDKYFARLVTGDESLESFNESEIRVPSKRTIIDLSIMDGLSDALEDAIVTTCRPGKDLDFAFALDASGFGTTMLQNWREEVWGKRRAVEGSKDKPAVDAGITEKRRPGRPKKKTDVPKDEDEAKEETGKQRRPYIKAHVSYGIVSGLIYAINLTNSMGEGTADVQHFEDLVLKTVPNCNNVGGYILADRGYRDVENFKLAERFRRMLLVLTKKRHKPEDAPEDASTMAFVHWLAMEHPDVYRRFYRLRMKIESLFSAKKRRGGHVKLRIRRKDKKKFAALSYPDLLRPREHGRWLNEDGTTHSIEYGVPKSDASEKMRAKLCLMIAKELAGVARRNEALARAVAWNLSRLVRLKWEHDEEVDFPRDQAFTPINRISLPGNLKSA